MKLSFSLCALITILTVSGCATQPQAPAPVIPPVSKKKGPPAASAEARQYKEIQTLFNTGPHSTASERIEAFINKYPKSVLLDQVYNMQGLIFLGRKEPLTAVDSFKKSLSLSDESVFRFFVLYNLAAAQYDAESYEPALRSLTQVSPAAFDDTTRVKYHFLKARTHEKLGQHLEATETLLIGSQYLDQAPAEYAGTYEKFILGSLKQTKDAGRLSTLAQTYNKSRFTDQVLFRSATLSIDAGKTPVAEEQLKNLIASYPQSPRYPEAVELLRALQNQAVVNKATVGVLVPMTGKFARFGEKTLHGIELAFRVYNAKEPDSGVTIVVEDSGDTPEQAIAALERLYYKNHVSAVIGPLLSKGIEAVTQRAQDLGVPMISLAQQHGITGENIFYAAVTPDQQAKDIARYAVQVAGHKKIAILYPRDKSGQQYVKTFWDAVESYGGEIVGIESYSNQETDFREVIDRLAGLYYKEARISEWNALERQRRENKITRLTRKTEQYYRIKPIVDFDAVFIADEARQVGQMMPTFAYRDIDQMKFVGIATWNTQDLIARAQRHAENAVFVDSFFAGSEAPEIRSFTTRFESMTGEKPTAIEALAFDAASMLERVLLVTNSSAGRKEIRDLLKEIKNYVGTTGNIAYIDGELTRQLRTLTVKNGKIIELR